jgi:Cu(I)/Ag(I) efflux system membrane fusion protein
VNREPLVREIQATGIVAYDQARQAKVTAWVAGRLDRLLVTSVGQPVAKGQPVAEVYSPDLVAAQQEFLLALRSRDQFKNSSIPSIAQGGEGLVVSARQRLKLLGVTDEQLARLEKEGQPNIRLAIHSPLSGVVIEKLVQEGQYVNVGEPLFAVADLSRVWVELEIYESDLAAVKVGQPVSVTATSYPGRTFAGRVAFVYPFLDPKTRTVKARVELANPGLLLKPEMYVTASLTMHLGETLTVPVTAVIDTGPRKVVWVRIKQGVFAPREVKLGARSEDKVQVLSGLLRGDVVAASGGYLIDSEAQLSGQGGQPATPAGHEGHGAPAPAPPKKKDSLSMDDMKM